MYLALITIRANTFCTTRRKSWTTDTVIVFEASIDAISHACIYKDAGLDDKLYDRIALGGTEKTVGLTTYLQTHPNISRVVIAMLKSANLPDALNLDHVKAEELDELGKGLAELARTLPSTGRLKYGLLKSEYRQKLDVWLDQIMKSGYGVEVSVEPLVQYGSGVADYDITPIQNAVATFPEFGYQTYDRLLEQVDARSWSFKQNPYSYYSNRIHYIPLWYPDGDYTVPVCVFDAWMIF